MTDQLDPGDPWPGYYRGYRLQTNAEGEVWWQVYQGTTRLRIQPQPDELVEQLLSVDRLGGRVHVTEDGTALTRIEQDADEHQPVYVGDVSLSGQLVPPADPDHAVPIAPSELAPGDVWPSVYDGAKFSFSGDRVWWEHPQTNRYHPVTSAPPEAVLSRLQQYKPQGGSFRVTPWGDVITLVEMMPDRERNPDQIRDLPRIIKNITLKRKERGVDQLPVYVGSVDQTPFEIADPESLTADLEPSGPTEGDSWAESLGSTTETDHSDHRAGPDK